MDICKDNIKFTFYFEGNKYIVFFIENELNFGDNLYFAKELSDGSYDTVNDDEYDKVLKEYKEYLEFSEDGE